VRSVVAFLGLLIGGLLGAALVLLNPITLAQGTPAGLNGAVRTFSWAAGGGYRGFDLTPSGLLGARGDEPGAGFDDAGIRYARAEVVMLTGEPGAPAALGVRLSAVARANALLKARLGTTTAWNLVWPERGTVLLAGSENYWAPLRDGLWSAVRGRGFAPGGDRYPLPSLPGLGAPALVHGTGAFAGAKGGFREVFAPLPQQPAEFTGERQLRLALE
jgi:hypothetical protein